MVTLRQLAGRRGFSSCSKLLSGFSHQGVGDMVPVQSEELTCLW